MVLPRGGKKPKVMGITGEQNVNTVEMLSKPKTETFDLVLRSNWNNVMKHS